MPVNWGIQGQGFNALEALQTFGQAQQQGMQRQQMAMKQQEQQARVAARQTAAQQLGAGDFSGAGLTAATAGDNEFTDFVFKARDEQRKQLAEETGVMGSLAAQLRSQPPEARAQAFAALAPQLAQRGFDQNELANVDLSDAGLGGYIAMATKADDALKAYADSQKPFELSAGQTRYSADGQVIAQNAPMPKWQFDSESGSWLQEPGSGNGQPVQQQGYAASRPAPVAGGGGSATSGRTQFGWTPRARNGGDNTDAAVDGKISGMSRALGISPDQDLSNLSPVQIARALAISEGGAGSLADRNNNPGNIRDPKTGGYRQFASKNDGINAAAAQVRRNLARGQTTIRTMVEGLPVGGGGQQGGQSQPGVVNVRAPKTRRGTDGAPSGYRYNGDRLEPIPGGPADRSAANPKAAQDSRKSEAGFRKEFEQSADAKSFRIARTQFNALRDTAMNPKATAQDDIAVIFSFMKTLDPTSTVREGEFATAQNAGGVPENIRSAYQKALNGERLSPEKRRNMVRTAYRGYQAFRNTYNERAEQFRGYARDSGINPDNVARTYTPNIVKNASRATAPSGGGRISPTIRRIN